MAMPARDNYLLTEVKTAAPQKLQWLLIEAAIRSANRAREFWRQGRDDLAIVRIAHAQGVLGEMLAAIDRDAGGELAQRVSGLYEFIFRLLVRAGHRHDETCLADAVRILEIERETWRQLCAKISADRIPGRPAAPQAGHAVIFDLQPIDVTEGFSLEA
jgi:flagellar protein FliS